VSQTKAISVTIEGEPDGWSPEACYHGELDPRGPTRLVASVPADQLPRVHEALIRCLQPPLSVLYRQKVDRRNPKPNGAPPRDFVALQLSDDHVLSAITKHSMIVYGDARAELWVRDNLNAQVVLDQDGMLFAYPDDPSFRDALDGAGVPEATHQTMAERDYVKHWFHAEADAHEDGLMENLGLQEVPHRR